MGKLSTRYVKAIALLALSMNVILSSACTSMTSTPKITVDATEQWALLPVKNLSGTAEADAQAKSLIESRLRSRGITSVNAEPSVQQVTLRQLVSGDYENSKAKEWARRSGYRYALTGTVLEWQYKSGADREPSVGLGLKLLDLQSNRVVWQANASRTGWGYASLSGVADGIIEDMLDEIELATSSR